MQGNRTTSPSSSEGEKEEATPGGQTGKGQGEKRTERGRDSVVLRQKENKKKCW